MDQDIAKAVQRSLRIMRNEPVVSVQDVVAAVRIMVPQAEADAATVTRHLSQLLNSGHEPPFKIVG